MYYLPFRRPVHCWQCTLAHDCRRVRIATYCLDNWSNVKLIRSLKKKVILLDTQEIVLGFQLTSRFSDFLALSLKRRSHQKLSACFMRHVTCCVALWRLFFILQSKILSDRNSVCQGVIIRISHSLSKFLMSYFIPSSYPHHVNFVFSILQYGNVQVEILWNHFLLSINWFCSYQHLASTTLLHFGT